jgi:hypothetical protein
LAKQISKTKTFLLKETSKTAAPIWHFDNQAADSDKAASSDTDSDLAIFGRRMAENEPWNHSNP